MRVIGDVGIPSCSRNNESAATYLGWLDGRHTEAAATVLPLCLSTSARLVARETGQEREMRLVGELVGEWGGNGLGLLVRRASFHYPTNPGRHSTYVEHAHGGYMAVQTSGHVHLGPPVVEPHLAKYLYKTW